MPIVVQCSQCGQRYQVSDQMAGKQAKCQKCGSAVPIPIPGGAPAAPTQPVTPSQPMGGQPGFGMMNRTGRGLAMTGSILAMLPCSLAWPISLGLGIWAMIALSQNKGAFR